MREQIIQEIQRLASENNGSPPGYNAFARATGIGQGRWRGVIWARWGDALAEAGFTPNVRQTRFNSNHVLRKVADLCLNVGRLASAAEIRLERKRDDAFPSHNVVGAHFPGRQTLVAALRELADQDARYAPLRPLLPSVEEPAPASRAKAEDGSVYLLKSGQHYKVGRSNELERRVKEVRVALPEAVTLVHSIKTDDPPGIEAYWHRRFADRRANGEWFRLTSEDVRAFRRRTFQ